nr:MAG TPA: hypothetical protein [Caudoviricetes sp.]
MSEVPSIYGSLNLLYDGSSPSLSHCYSIVCTRRL